MKFFEIKIKPIDSANYYDLSNIKRHLPEVNTIEEAIVLLQPDAPTLFQQGKIIMYNDEFAKRITNMLIDYGNSSVVKSKEYIKFINKFYETEEDFFQTPNTKIFVNKQDLDSWLNFLKFSHNYNQHFGIRREINQNMGLSLYPYIYQDTDGKIYIIQNVIGGSIEKAFAVSDTWINQQINVGADPKPLDLTSPYILYGLSSSSTLTPIEYKGDIVEEQTVRKILYYGIQADRRINQGGRHAALLQIL